MNPLRQIVSTFGNVMCMLEPFKFILIERKRFLHFRLKFSCFGLGLSPDVLLFIPRSYLNSFQNCCVVVQEKVLILSKNHPGHDLEAMGVCSSVSVDLVIKIMKWSIRLLQEHWFHFDYYTRKTAIIPGDVHLSICYINRWKWQS